MNEQHKSISLQDDAIRQAVLVVQNIALNGLLFAALGIYLAIQTGGAWQAYQFIVLSVQVVVIGFVSLALIRRGRLTLGVWIFFASDLIAPIWASLLVSKLGYVAVAYILVTTYFMIRYAIPKESQRVVWMLTAFGVVVSFIAELVAPTWRLVSPLMLVVSPILTGILGMVFIVIIVRQAFGGSLRTKLVIAFLAVTIIPLAIISLITYYSSRTALTNDANQKLASAASTIAAELDMFIDHNLQTVRAAGQSSAVTDYLTLPPNQRAGSAEEARLLKFVTALSRQDPVFISSVAAFDTKGVDVADTSASDIGLNKADRVYFKDTMQADLPYASDVEHSATSGVPSIYFAAPVHDTAGKIIGLIRIRYPASILQKLIVDETGLAGESSYAVVLDSNHIRLAHGTDRDRVFKSIVPLDAALLKDLQSKGLMPAGTPQELGTNLTDFEAGLNNLEQVPFFASDTNGDGTLEQAAFASMTTKPWLVSAIQSEDVFLAPITTQTTNNVLIALLVALVVGVAGFFFSQTLAGPIVRLTQTAQKIAEGDINVQAKVETGDEIGTLAGTFNRMTQQLRDFIATLESRVADRTRNLELAGEVGRTVSQVRALDVMLKDAAELIRKQFDLYYVQVYLTNPSQTALVLQSGTGTVGAELVGRAHQLPLTTASINGRAAIEKKSVVISDTTTSPTFKSNPLLPDTRSEMAVPLMIGERVVGVLDMQSVHAGSLSTDILPAFEAMAGQLAIAIQNATFLAETDQARAEVEAQARRLSRANWVDYLDAIHKPEETGFVFEQNKIAPMTQEEQSQLSTNENAMTAPIAVTGESLGNLVVEMEGQSPIARTNELVNTVAQQVARQIESLRLLESAERYRFEAEEASRRITREGWKDYMDVNAANAKSLGYFYDLKEVRPYDQNKDQQSEGSTLSLPLKVRDETVGKLSVMGIKSDDNESFELVNAVAERLGAHIESLRQFDETQRGQMELDKRARQLAAVAEVSSVSSRELDINKMLESVVHLTQRQFGLYHAHVFTYNENTDALQIAACGWKEGDEHEGTHGATAIPLAQEQSLVARSARERQAVIVNDVRNESGWLPNPLLPDTASEMAVPLIIGDQILGVLDVQSDQVNAFSEEDANIYTTLGSQVSTALQNARSFVRAQKQAERETTLNLISQKIQVATTVEAVLQIAARELGHALGAPMTIAQLSMKDKK